VQVIELETEIAAPPKRCFLLSLSIDLHMESTQYTGEQAIAGVTSGLIGLNETVTWRARHFGVMLTHQTLITAYEEPHHFRDVMTQGMFRSFEHDHFFTDIASGHTRMKDVLRFSAPLGWLGLVVESVVLRRYMTNFLEHRNAFIKKTAEAPASEYTRFISIRA
jgi:ligand-binding SRPBCC domain-containing protein